MNKILATYNSQDMQICYLRGVDRKGHEVVGLRIIPISMIDQIIDENDDIEPLIQIKLVGDDYPFNYSQGRTMRNSETTFKLKYQFQEKIIKDTHYTIITHLYDDRGIDYQHYLSFDIGSSAINTFTKLINRTNKNIKIEMISSFTLGSITPFTKGLAKESLLMHQIKSTWAYEGRLVTRPIEESMLEPSWKPSGANSIRFGQVGSMPNREYFPFIAIEDKNVNVLWGIQLAIASSWQLEVYRKDNALCLSGGIADREKGHWLKILKPNQEFQTPKAIISVVQGNIDELSQRIVRDIQLDIKDDEKELPIIFNEFCTTWGNPQASEIKRTIDLLVNKGIKYFVIDCGWYKHAVDHNGSWNIQHGDWNYNRKLFPQGIKEVVDYIHQRGLKAGIWFEFESCGREAELFKHQDFLYQRDGYPITSGNRRFLNLLDQSVINYLDEHVLKFLEDNEFDYLKIDYNDNLGIGMDGGDSLGEQLYRGIKATQEYIRKIKHVLPNLIIENCSAGGHRLVEPFLKITDMSSFSDAHESLCIPIIGANLQRMILPRQSQIWAVVKPDQTIALLYYKISSGLLGRLCLSGNIKDLSKQQWQVIEEGITFYRCVSHIIDLGSSTINYQGGLSYKEPTGYQVVIRKYLDEALVVLHTFANSPAHVQVDLNNYEIIKIYGLKKAVIEKQRLVLRGLNKFDGMAVYLRRKNVNK